MAAKKQNETHRSLTTTDTLIPLSDVVSTQPTPELRLFILEAVKNKEITLYEIDDIFCISVAELKQRYPKQEFTLIKRIYAFRKKYRKTKHARSNT